MKYKTARHLFTRTVLSILLTLLALGILSLLERVLLSTVQYRHGPGSQTADGLALLLADGTKLYSKWGVTDRVHSLYLLLSALSFSWAVLLLSAITCASTQSWLHTEGIDWCLFTLAGLLLTTVLMLPSLTGGVYSQLSLLRALRGGLLADVAIEASIAVLATGQQSGATSYCSPLMYYVSPAACWWLTTMVIGGKPPFDFTEAESEMIAGVMTELAGGIFALALLTEGVELWLLTSLLAQFLQAHHTFSIAIATLIIISFIGRVVLARLQVADLSLLVLTRLMFIPVSFTNH